MWRDSKQTPIMLHLNLKQFFNVKRLSHILVSCVAIVFFFYSVNIYIYICIYSDTKISLVPQMEQKLHTSPLNIS